MRPDSVIYQKNALNHFLFKLSMWKELPSVAFWGIKISVLDEAKCEVKIPFTWRTQNPFRSIYFGALLGAAELSTGALCQMYIKGLGNYSMLVIGFRSEFVKKASTETTFVCEQGRELADLLEGMKNSGDTGTLEMIALGHNTNSEIVAKAYITWSFKRK